MISTVSRERRLGSPLIELDTVDSTMLEVERRAASAEEGLAVIAQRQTAGRGRGDRVWISADQHPLLFSVLLRPAIAPQDFAAFSLVAGLAIAEAIEGASRCKVSLKWPNDLLLGGNKCGGILLKSSVQRSKVEHAVLGVGINAGSSPETVPSASSLNLPLESMEQLRRNVFDQLTLRYNQLLAGESRRLLDEWTRKAAFIGEEILIDNQGKAQRGRLAGIDDWGRLKLEDDLGGMTTVAAGDLVRGPRAATARSAD